MPLLKREVDMFPENLFSAPPEGRPWQVLHVRSRHEKVVARSLVEAAVPFYLPQIEKHVRKGGRTFTSHIPLFPGYVFYKGGREDLSVLWRTGGVVRVLPVQDEALLAEELLQLVQLQQAGAKLIPHPFVTVGDEVRITDGIFAGYRGVVVREKGSETLVVSVSIIHRSVAVELAREAVAPIRS